MSEKEEEKKKKAISIDLSTIDHNLSEAIRVQTQMMTSPIVVEALQTAKIFDSFNYMTESLRYVESVNRMVRDNKIIFTAFEYSNESWKAMQKFGAETMKLLHQFNEASRMVESIKIPEIVFPKLETELMAIPPQNDTLVRSLLREIDILERELAKEKEENKKIIALLDEKRKYLRKQYVT